MYKEFIGMSVEIIDSKNITLKGKKGKIIDETKNLIIIEEYPDKIIKVLKNKSIFKINNKKIIGNHIQKRPEDRIKLIKKLS